jgi:hypothetical protein
MTLIGQIRRIGDDKIEILMILGVNRKRILVIVEEKVFAVHLESFIILKEFDIDLVQMSSKIGQIGM